MLEHWDLEVDSPNWHLRTGGEKLGPSHNTAELKSYDLFTEELWKVTSLLLWQLRDDNNGGSYLIDCQDQKR